MFIGDCGNGNIILANAQKERRGEKEKENSRLVDPAQERYRTSHLFETSFVDGTRGTAAGPFRTDVRVLLRGIIAP